jgi:hypothetical protein
VTYLNATASSHSRPGQGMRLKNGKKIALDGYARRGNPATETNVLFPQSGPPVAGTCKAEAERSTVAFERPAELVEASLPLR